MTGPALDRASFLLGYLVARLDSAPDILEMVSHAEALLDGEDLPPAVLATLEPQPEPEEPAALPAPKPKAPPKVTPTGGYGSRLLQVVALYRQGLSGKKIAARLMLGKEGIYVHISNARKKGLLPISGSAEDSEIKARRKTAAPAHDVTAALMGDPAPERAAPGEYDG